jgi:hypothetical protein
MKLRLGAGLERAIDAAVLVVLVVVAIRTASDFTRVATLIAAFLLQLGWFFAWRRWKHRTSETP